VKENKTQKITVNKCVSDVYLYGIHWIRIQSFLMDPWTSFFTTRWLNDFYNLTKIMHLKFLNIYYASQKDFRTPREAPSLSEKTFSSSKKNIELLISSSFWTFFFLDPQTWKNQDPSGSEILLMNILYHTYQVTVTNSLVDSDPGPHRSVLIFDDWIRILQVVKNYPRKEIN
jgi:hypothetical protein